MKSRFGFTLVELLATMAVMGVLVAIAAPNYTRYKRRALQAEAKVSLGGLFLVEQNLMTDQHSFSACYASIMGNAIGADYYAVGFNTTAGTQQCRPYGDDALTNTVTNRDCTVYAWNKDTGTGKYTIAAQCTGNTANHTYFAAPSDNSLIILNSQISWSAFTAQAVGDLGGASKDKWEINEEKAIYQTGNGI